MWSVCQCVNINWTGGTSWGSAGYIKIRSATDMCGFLKQPVHPQASASVAVWLVFVQHICLLFAVGIAHRVNAKTKTPDGYQNQKSWSYWAFAFTYFFFSALGIWCCSFGSRMSFSVHLGFDVFFGLGDLITYLIDLSCIFRLSASCSTRGSAHHAETDEQWKSLLWLLGKGRPSSAGVA